MKVLDIGSGAGGSAFYMARNYKVDVQGIDLSTNMNGISLDYRKEMEPDVKHRCHFYIEDADKMEFPENFFDVVYSRDTIMHFKDVKALDKTDRMVEIMKMELKKFHGMKDSFIKKYSQKDYNDLDEGWKEKLVWCPGGLMAWGLFMATKPTK